jgi:vancomycin resistance protein VanW
MKFKHLRLFLDDFKSFLNGYQFAIQRYSSNQNLESWYLLAEFATTIRNRAELGTVNQNRIENMKLSCSMADGLILEPGEVFSFRKIIGEPLPERGFLAGPMIIGDSLGFTIGGGLCQISTTLFNAALIANLKILEKHNHSRDIWGTERFIDLGRDAVCVYGRKDLKFRNTFHEPILLRVKVNNELAKVECRIYTKREQQFTVEVNSRILKKLTPKPIREKSETDSWQPVMGWVVETVRRVNYGRKTWSNYKKREFYKPGWRRIG